MGTYRSEQEEFWAGDFGDEYIGRNKSSQLIAGNTALFSDVLQNARNVNSVIEFGANVGLNIVALQRLLPRAKFSAVEINESAVLELRKNDFIDVFHQSIFDHEIQYQHDFAFTKTVLIHIAPEFLPAVYDKLYESSSRYICVAEYYSPAPVEVNYRGHQGKLFKRDFAGEMLSRFEDLSLVSYGFYYRNDPTFPLDDITWFLLEKK